MSISDLYRNMGPVGPVSPQAEGLREAPAPKTGEVTDFEKILREHQQPGLSQEKSTSEGLRFSNHAETRIRSRAIQWNPELEKRVSDGIDSAKEKGSRETLILAGNVAVIANVNSRTVITAMDASKLKDRIFTNIDSAVIV